MSGNLVNMEIKIRRKNTVILNWDDGSATSVVYSSVTENLTDNE